MRFRGFFALSAVVALLGGCGGGGGSSTSGQGSCNPGVTTAVSIRSTGFSPSAVCVEPNGGQVVFNNQDTVPHTIVANTNDCTELNIGPIAAGANLAATFSTAATKVCTFHDSANSSSAFVGTVAVTSLPAEGPGY
jgi:plastocyanin